MSPTAGQNGRQINFIKFQETGKLHQMAKVWDSFQLESEVPLLLGCNRWPLLQMRDPDAFTHEGGGQVYYEKNGRRVSEMERVDSSQSIDIV